ncbi:MAG: response regulator [Sedimenticola sp.]|nr:response regulator [Sedimenticola sp.]
MTQAKILVADDDIFTLTQISSGLGEAGYQVLSAEDGAEAVRIGLEYRPDLAILDIRMPGMSGIEAARELRQQGRINALFLSAYSDREIVEKATREGALGYLVKPLNIQQLIPAIEAALRRAKDLQQLQQKKEDLTEAIGRNREISVAVGIYMERFAVGERIAFDALRRFARSQRVKLAALARDLVTDHVRRDQLIQQIRQHADAAN